MPRLIRIVAWWFTILWRCMRRLAAGQDPCVMTDLERCRGIRTELSSAAPSANSANIPTALKSDGDSNETFAADNRRGRPHLLDGRTGREAPSS